MTASRAVALAVIAGLAWTARAHAEPTPADSALAQALFDQAVTLMDKGDYPSACPELVESQRLDPAGGTLLNIGLCREKEGKLASAWLAYNDALSQAIKDARADRESTARARIAAIGDKVSKVVVTVPAPVASLAGLDVKLDETPLRQAAWGVPTPIDKGSHELTAVAPGKRPTKLVVSVRADGESVTVTVPALEDAPVVAAGVVRPPIERASSRTMAFALGGVGLASLAVGVVSGVLAINRRSQSDAECPNDQCNQRGVDLNDQAKSLAWVADVTVGVGLVALGAGIVVYLVSPKAPATAAWLGPTGLRGSF